MLAQMQGMLQDAVMPGHAAGGGVVQKGAPVGIAEGPGGPIAGEGRSRASRGQASYRVTRLRWLWLGQGATRKRWPPARLGLRQNPTSRKY